MPSNVLCNSNRNIDIITRSAAIDIDGVHVGNTCNTKQCFLSFHPFNYPVSTAQRKTGFVFEA